MLPVSPPERARGSFAPPQSKVVKRYYTSVKQFVDDVDVMLANALFFNEEASRIWKDARMLQVRRLAPPAKLTAPH